MLRVVMVLFKIIGENKKTKLRENENIYTTPVFLRNRFNFVVLIQKWITGDTKLEVYTLNVYKRFFIPTTITF